MNELDAAWMAREDQRRALYAETDRAIDRVLYLQGQLDSAIEYLNELVHKLGDNHQQERTTFNDDRF